MISILAFGTAVSTRALICSSDSICQMRWIGLSEDDTKKNAASPPNINIALGDRDPPFIARSSLDETHPHSPAAPDHVRQRPARGTHSVASDPGTPPCLHRSAFDHRFFAAIP